MSSVVVTTVHVGYNAAFCAALMACLSVTFLEVGQSQLATHMCKICTIKILLN